MKTHEQQQAEHARRLAWIDKVETLAELVDCTRALAMVARRIGGRGLLFAGDAHAWRRAAEALEGVEQGQV